MSLVALSCLVGFGSIIVIPVMVTWVHTAEARHRTRPERLETWLLSTLLATTFLAIYTKMFVEQGGVVLMDTTTLWVFCVFGAVLSFSIGTLLWLLTRRQRKLEARLIEAVLRP